MRFHFIFCRARRSSGGGSTDHAKHTRRYIDKVLDPQGKYNVNKGKGKLADGTIVVAKQVEDE